MQQLYVNGILLDLDANVNINRTLQLNSIGEIEKKKSNFSSTLKVRMTPNNIKAFNYLGVSGNTSLSTYQPQDCSYFFNSIPVFTNGKIVVRSVANGYYNVNLYDGIFSLGTVLDDSTISDLYIADFTHRQEPSFILGQYAAGGYPVVSYPLNINYLSSDVYRNPTELYLEEFFPSVQCKSIFDRIFDSNNLTVSGDVYDEPSIFNEFEKEYITLSEGYKLTPTPIAEGELIEADFETENSFNDTRKGVLKNFSYTRTQEISNTSDNNSDFLLSSTGFYTRFDGFAKFEIEVRPVGFEYGSISVYIKNSTTGEALKVAEISSSSGVTNITRSIDVFSGNNYQLVLTFRSSRSGSLHRLKVSDVFCEMNAVKQVSGGRYIASSKMNIDVKQLDFVKDILTRYGLVIYADPANPNHYITKSINNLLDTQKNNVVDWSEKLISITQESTTNSYEATNYFKYKYPNEEEYNDGFFDITNTLNTSEKIIYTSPLECFPLTNRVQDQRFVYNVEEMRFGSEYVLPQSNLVTYSDDDGYEGSIDSSKIFKLVHLNYFGGVEIGFKDQTRHTIDGYMCAIPVNSMQYNLENFYPNFLKVLSRYKKVNADFFVNNIELYNFNVSSLIFLRQTGKYYYIEKIKHNVNNSEVKAELIEIPV